MQADDIRQQQKIVSPIFFSGYHSAMTTLGHALMEARIAHGLTQAQLADRIGISQTFLSDIERGVRELPPARRALLPPPIRSAVLAAERSRLLARLAEIDRERAELGRAAAHVE
jgi:transcriptional regulator with XRE-family HTH domain